MPLDKPATGGRLCKGSTCTRSTACITLTTTMACRPAQSPTPGLAPSWPWPARPKLIISTTGLYAMAAAGMPLPPRTTSTWRMPAHSCRRGAAAWLLLAALIAAACMPVTRPVVKIGLVAPFEGRYREVGYEVIYAVRLAVREANAAGGVAGFSVELTALDDGGDPASAAEQARKLGTDPQIAGVIGDWLDATTLNAAPLYAAEGLP